MVHALRQVLEGGFYAPPSMMGAILGALPESGGSGADEHGLTQRQRQVLECLCQGLANKEIARQLNLTQNTIKTHISAIFKTLGVMSRTQAIIEARARGIVQG
jgi:DNA-binding NarL/FixJ family response regulator